MYLTENGRTMKNAKSIFHDIVSDITLQESPDEIKSIVWILLGKVLGISQTDILAGKVVSVTPDTTRILKESVKRINNHEPIQYIVGEAHFYGRTFQVDPAVLIPRPETEELIRTVLSWKRTRKGYDKSPLKILDIGTGSGCIAITLSLECEGAGVYASDVSPQALSIAALNARRQEANVNFIEHDILREGIPFRNVDAIVSNPPYIPESEKRFMQTNILSFEPELALFVPDDDPLRFFREIVQKAEEALTTGGLLAVEINERFGREVREVFMSHGFAEVAILADVAGKSRVVKGTKTS